MFFFGGAFRGNAFRGCFAGDFSCVFSAIVFRKVHFFSRPRSVGVRLVRLVWRGLRSVLAVARGMLAVVLLGDAVGWPMVWDVDGI